MGIYFRHLPETEIRHYKKVSMVATVEMDDTDEMTHVMAVMVCNMCGHPSGEMSAAMNATSCLEKRTLKQLHDEQPGHAAHSTADSSNPIETEERQHSLLPLLSSISTEIAALPAANDVADLDQEEIAVASAQPLHPPAPSEQLHFAGQLQPSVEKRAE